jgi:hypothetical protein
MDDMTWEEKQEQRKAQEKKQWYQNETILKAIALAMGKPWEMEQEKEERETYYRFYGTLINTDTGEAIHFNEVLNKPKFHISGIFPRSKSKNEMHIPYEYRGGISIEVSQTKKPEIIANDIKRRLLPEYSQAYQKALAIVNQWDEHYYTTEKNCKLLADIIGARIDKNEPNKARFYNGMNCINCDIYVSSNKVKLTIDDLTMGQATTILELINHWKGDVIED